MAILGVCPCGQKGAGLSCHTHLLCKTPAPNVAAHQAASNIASRQPTSQQAVIPMQSIWDGAVSLRYTGCSASAFIRV